MHAMGDEREPESDLPAEDNWNGRDGTVRSEARGLRARVLSCGELRGRRIRADSAAEGGVIACDGR